MIYMLSKLYIYILSKLVNRGGETVGRLLQQLKEKVGLELS